MHSTIYCPIAVYNALIWMWTKENRHWCFHRRLRRMDETAKQGNLVSMRHAAQYAP